MSHHISTNEPPRMLQNDFFAFFGLVATTFTLLYFTKGCLQISETTLMSQHFVVEYTLAKFYLVLYCSGCFLFQLHCCRLSINGCKLISEATNCVFCFVNNIRYQQVTCDSRSPSHLTVTSQISWHEEAVTSIVISELAINLAYCIGDIPMSQLML